MYGLHNKAAEVNFARSPAIDDPVDAFQLEQVERSVSLLDISPHCPRETPLSPLQICLSRLMHIDPMIDCSLLLPTLLRWSRIVFNDLENIPVGLIVAWGSALTAGLEGGSADLHLIGVTLFGAARVLHGISFAKAVSIPRSTFYMCGVAGVLIMQIQILRAVY